jgi:[NiFe] hydrogenase diaphorase moiety large subunit
MEASIQQIIDRYNGDPVRLMDILLDIKEEKGFIPSELNQGLANALGISKASFEEMVSFYHFFPQTPVGKYTVYLNNSVVANMMGREQVKKTFEEEAGIKFGNISSDGLIGLFETSCIGMSDQEPAAIINDKIFVNLTPFRAKEIIRDMKAGKPVEQMYQANFGDGNNSSELIRSVVGNHIRRKGPVIWDPHTPGEALRKAVNMDPGNVIEEIKHSNLRGRGGAGFPTGLKWEFCSKSRGDRKYVICNADEGEPGTFKDRVILTELPKLVFEGMAVAGYAIGAEEGIIYIRYEYKYLQRFLEKVLEELRADHIIGKDAGGRKGFNFNIRIQYGAGAYVCGEESGLLESAEGKRGEPRDRPPFPVDKGYLQQPTVINNVETLCSVVKIIKHGSEWYTSFGTKESSGTKLLSVAGDCRFPGVYEIEWGFTIYDIIQMVGATDVQAVQVGGPSGTLIHPNEFRRKLGYEDMPTGGSIIIFNKSRNLLKDVVLNFIDFFIEESCGSCSICRNLPLILKNKLVKILDGNGVMQDIEDLNEWSKLCKYNRCGLGQTAANPIITSLLNFRYLYEEIVRKDIEYETGFSLAEAVRESCEASDRKPLL